MATDAATERAAQRAPPITPTIADASQEESEALKALVVRRDGDADLAWPLVDASAAVPHRVVAAAAAAAFVLRLLGGLRYIALLGWLVG